MITLARRRQFGTVFCGIVPMPHLSFAAGVREAAKQP